MIQHYHLKSHSWILIELTTSIAIFIIFWSQSSKWNSLYLFRNSKFMMLTRFLFVGFWFEGMGWKYMDTLHGRFWTTLNGILATPCVLELTSSITRIIWKDTRSSLLIGSGIFFKNNRFVAWWYPMLNKTRTWSLIKKFILNYKYLDPCYNCFMLFSILFLNEILVKQ